MALLTWLGVYPVLTLAVIVLEPWIGDLPTALRTLITSSFMVPAMVFGVMPAIHRILACLYQGLDPDRIVLQRNRRRAVVEL